MLRRLSIRVRLRLAFGIILAMIGVDPQTGQERWTFDTLYLQDGLPLTPLLLGVFALPELCDLMIARMAMFFGGGRRDDREGSPIAALATVIIGGLTSTLIFAPLIIPPLYLWLESKALKTINAEED